MVLSFSSANSFKGMVGKLIGMVLAHQLPISLLSSSPHRSRSQIPPVLCRTVIRLPPSIDDVWVMVLAPGKQVLQDGLVSLKIEHIKALGRVGQV